MKLMSLGLLLAIELTACVSSPHQTHNAVSESDLSLEQQRLRDIIVYQGKAGHGLAGLRQVIEAPAFQLLDVEDQFQALTLAVAGTAPGEAALKHSYLDRAMKLGGIGFEDLEIALRMSVNAGYAAGALKSLTLLAQQWPDKMASIDILLVRRALYLNDHAPRAEKLMLLKALYAAHWRLEWNMEPSRVWRDLALLLVEEGSVDDASDVSKHVTDAYVLAAMRADRRFDAIVAAIPAHFDVEAAALRERKLYQALSDQNPKSLVLKDLVLETLLQEQHYAAMLAESDAVMQAIRSTNYPAKLYDEYVEQHSRYFYLRSIALQRAGRWDEALAQAVDAAHEGDINQLINLANLYWALDRSKDALFLLSTIGSSRVSPYGAMQVETVRLQAAVRVRDRQQIIRSSRYLSEHRVDSPADYAASLLITKQLDLAAAYVVSELRDPELRQDALLDVQEFQPAPGTEQENALEAQWRAVVARKEVQEAIHQVGRIESYRLEAPN
jgi:beta-barrel assembly-enhancing protease